MSDGGETMNAMVQASGAELAQTSAAAKAKAEVEAAYVVAVRRPRNIDDARVEILKSCRRPRFAGAARYIKPVGGSKIEGPSIRFAEMALQAFKNMRIDVCVMHEDEEKRLIHVSVTDLESNVSYGEDAILNKTVERNTLKPGHIVCGERVNTNGQKVYIVRATEDELSNKTGAAKSKIVRNCGLRLIPQDIIEEAMDTVKQTLSSGGGEDQDAVRKGISDAFSELGIKPSEIEAYLGHPISQMTRPETADMRAIFSAIRDGEAKWADYVDARGKPEVGKLDMKQISAGDVSKHVAVSEPISARVPADDDAPVWQKQYTPEQEKAAQEVIDKVLDDDGFEVSVDSVDDVEDIALKGGKKKYKVTTSGGATLNAWDESIANTCKAEKITGRPIKFWCKPDPKFGLQLKKIEVQK